MAIILSDQMIQISLVNKLITVTRGDEMRKGEDRDEEEEVGGGGRRRRKKKVG